MKDKKSIKKFIDQLLKVVIPIKVFGDATHSGKKNHNIPS